MSEFWLNLPPTPRQYTKVCLCCQKEYKAKANQQKYCNNPCKPLTASEKRAGITDQVRRGEAVAVPTPDYYEKPVPAKGKKCDNESLGETSRKYLSMRL